MNEREKKQKKETKFDKKQKQSEKGNEEKGKSKTFYDDNDDEKKTSTNMFTKNTKRDWKVKKEANLRQRRENRRTLGNH